MSYHKILIAIDSSEYSIAAAKKGFDLAHQLNAKVALIYVIDKARTLGSIDAGIMPNEALIAVKKEVEQTLSQVAVLYNGKELMKFMPEGHPMTDIINTAQVWKADLIVMGTHGRTGLLHLIMGSVAEHVVRHSEIPVLIVPSKEQD